MADVANAETVGLRDLAGVNDEAFIVEAIVKILKIKIFFGNKIMIKLFADEE